MKEIAIIGSSISGSSLAYLLAKAGCSVKVFEEKSQQDTGRKVCANIVTSDFIEITKEFGLNIKGVIKNRLKGAIFLCEKNSVEFPIDDYEIDRAKFINLLLKKAKTMGARFYFRTRFLNLKESNGRYEIVLQKNRKIVKEKADYVIGADGALSKVAKRINIGNKKEFWLAVQTKIYKVPRGKERKKYFIFLGSKFGYYSYIFPSKRYFTIGTLSFLKQHNKFNDFLKYIGIKGIKKREAALIPIYNPAFRFRKNNILIIGDSAGMTKFTGCGIVPSLKAALWAQQAILGKKDKESSNLRKLRQELFLHYLIYKALKRFSDDDFNKYLEIAKDKSVISAVASRDDIKKWIFKIARRKPELIRLLPKLI
jgi:flavin-dependent dehydrogenase